MHFVLTKMLISQNHFSFSIQYHHLQKKKKNRKCKDNSFSLKVLETIFIAKILSLSYFFFMEYASLHIVKYVQNWVSEITETLIWISFPFFKTTFTSHYYYISHTFISCFKARRKRIKCDISHADSHKSLIIWVLCWIKLITCTGERPSVWQGALYWSCIRDIFLFKDYANYLCMFSPRQLTFEHWPVINQKVQASASAITQAIFATRL